MESSADQLPPTQPQLSQEGWTLVTRRRRPVHFQPSPYSPPQQARIFNPLSPSYAQILQQNPSLPGQPRTTIPQPLPHPVSPKQKFVRPPNSPTNLPYPPNPYHKEWWGRCFRCAQKGHIVADCTYPRMLAAASTPDLPILDHNPSTLRPTATPFSPAAAPLSPAHHPRLSIFKSNFPEPGFDELLLDPEPRLLPQMPADRPKKALCYFNRDHQYFGSLQNLLRGIVVQPPVSLIGNFSLDKAANLLAASSKVLPTQLQVAWLSQDRVLAIPPPPPQA